MDKYPKKTIGELCHIEKGVTGLASADPGPYPLVATSLERKSCNTYQFDTQAVCIPLVSSTGHGKKTLNYVHYQEGKFALGTILAAVIPKDAGILSAGFLHRYLQFFKETKLVSLMKGAANVSLAVKDIAKIDISVPPIEEQIKFIELFNKANNFGIQLVGEFNTQSNYLKQLRQSILQEAIEGKLTADWRKSHPVVKGNPDFDAEALLDAVKAERKKSKKNKFLPEVSDSEKPFELPVSWIWCTPNDLGVFSGGGTPSTGVKKYWNGSIPWVTSKDMKFEDIYNSELKITEIATEESNANLLPTNTLLMVVRSGILKRTIPVAINRVECTINQDLKSWRLYFPAMAEFLRLNIKGNEARLLQDIVKKGMTVESFDFDKFKSYSIPLPSLSEQQAIVDRVDSLLAMVDLLEKQVNERKVMADELMQSVLRGAFG